MVVLFYFIFYSILCSILIYIFFCSFVFLVFPSFYNLNNSNHLNTGLVWYSNFRFVSSCQMVRFQMVVWKLDWKKPVYGPKCSVFRWIWYSGVGYSDDYCITKTTDRMWTTDNFEYQTFLGQKKNFCWDLNIGQFQYLDHGLSEMAQMLEQMLLTWRTRVQVPRPPCCSLLWGCVTKNSNIDLTCYANRC